MVDPDKPALSQHGDDQQQGAHLVMMAAPNVAFHSPIFDPYTRFPTESIYSASPPLSQPQSLPQTLPSTASHSNNAENKLYSLRYGSNATPMAVSSNEAKVSLLSHEGNGGELNSRPVTSAHEECIVGVAISTAGNAGCCSSEDMDSRTVLEDVQVGTPPSNEGSIKMEFNLNVIKDDSPFPEVRASVSNSDEPTMYAMTIRMWFVGLFLCSVTCALNTFFNLRYPAPYISPIVLLLVSYPMGKFLAFSLPMTSYRVPLPYLPPSCIPSILPTPLARLIRPITLPQVLEFSLNPGPWNIKEHLLVCTMANVTAGNQYAINAIVTSQIYYGLSRDFWFLLLLLLAMQLTGFGLAGLCRRFLIWPASMVWPQNLAVCAVLNTLHGKDDEEVRLGGASGSEEGGGVGTLVRWSMRPMTRYRHFIIVFIGSFLYFFLPGYLFQALSIFSFICWAAPNNVVVNQLFGVHSGLGMSFLTFDWTQIAWVGSPLMFPWWAQLNTFIGFVSFVWILTPALYYTDSWYTSYFPISGNSPYDRFGQVYNITRVLTSDYLFDPVAYNEYSPLFLPATFAVAYLAQFALLPCILIHTLLYHGRSLLNGLKRDVEADDIHAKLMRHYPEVPDWWYLTFFFSFALAVVAVEVWDTGIPVWSLLLSIALPAIYVLPAGFVFAQTGLIVLPNILAELISGSLLPGNPVANMVFKAYSGQTIQQAMGFLQDLKLGHYIKVPPRATFLAQLIATVFVTFVQIGVHQWIFANVKDICSPTQSDFLICPFNQVWFTASAIWGLIGPSRQFGTGTIYHPWVYAFIVGTFLPLPFWLWKRRHPQSWVRWVSMPLILLGMAYIPPAVGINYSSWFLVGFVFQYLIYKHNFAWWSKFNYVTSAAMDSGTAFSVLFIFFTLQFPKDGTIAVNWWGNNVFTKTADWSGPALKLTPPGGIPVDT